MEKDVVKLMVFNGDDFGYWKKRTRNYLLSQGCVIWEIVQEPYMIPDTLDHATQGELQRYENNYKTFNLINIALGRNVYDRVAHLEMTHDVWLKLCKTPMRVLLKLSLHVEILITCNIRLPLRNLESPWMTAFLGLSLLLTAYVHVVLLLILIMNVLINCFMILIIMCGV
jgi:hypothetical protein